MTPAMEYSLLKLNIPFPCDPTDPLPGMCPREVETNGHTKTRSQMFRAGLFM